MKPKNKQKKVRVISFPTKNQLKLTPEQQDKLQSIFDWEKSSKNRKGVLLK